MRVDLDVSEEILKLLQEEANTRGMSRRKLMSKVLEWRYTDVGLFNHPPTQLIDQAFKHAKDNLKFPLSPDECIEPKSE